MNKTKIPTAEYTLNATTGCDRICFDGDCYAYQMIKRFGKTWGYDWTPRFHPERLKELSKLKAPSLIFLPSMGDLFTPSLSDLVIQTVLDEIELCNWHRVQIQTKFEERLPEFSYPSNVWLGVSLCYESDIIRLNYLRKTDARIKYAYCEPVLEAFEPDFSGIDWVVIGAKTGARPFQPDPLWVSNLTYQAKACGAKVFHKPNLDVSCPSDFNYPRRGFPDEEWFNKHYLIVNGEMKRRRARA